MEKPLGPDDEIQVERGPDFQPPNEEVQGLAAPAEVGDDGADIVLPEEGEKWWLTLESEDDLKSHERAKPWLDEAEDSARRNVYGQLQPLVQQRNVYLQQLVRDGGRVAKEIERAARDGTLDTDLADRYEEMSGKMSGAYWHLGRFDGAKGFLLELSQALGDEKLLDDFRPRIDLLEQGGEDKRLFPDLLKKLAQGAAGKESEASEKKGYDAGVAAGRKAAIEELRARQRNGQGPDLARKTTAGGAALSIERYKTMSHEERAKLTPQQIDAMTAELARLSAPN